MVAAWVRVGVVGVFLSYVAWVAKPGSSLFSWHPVCMTLAFTGLMTEAVFMFSKSGLAAGRVHSTKITAHWVVLILVATVHGVGFAAIYYNKELNNKPHFVSWHGCVGLAASVLLWVQLNAGVFAKYPKLLKSIMQVKTVKANHGLFGMFMFTTSMVTIVLGLCTTWFQDNASRLAFYSSLGLHILLVLIVGKKLLTKYGGIPG
ncbi:transmembrane reductase CYB561D2 [Procambarus clarkii]|uniref:transmembrane reductase CYB561D2 n=1 Tax=Procambarus clarkii TaxID=6728 RepID=UPI001E6750D7|nr:transmembrane reductase CYB561D2-like [Procambarus clarkii]